MTIHPIVIAGEPVLHQPTREITEFDEKLRTLVDDMFETMYAAEGVGLAANQIGLDLRVFVYDCPDDEGVRHKGVVVNPKLETGASISCQLTALSRVRKMPLWCCAHNVSGAPGHRTTRCGSCVFSWPASSGGM